ncbi:MAG: hypothetical protein LEGION0403_FIIPPAGN_01801 [Legionella sp.]|uniref:hypothetical protein n=1 Tax=Legionella sp. TaxID=459 RepID=UPI003D0F4457
MKSLSFNVKRNLSKSPKIYVLSVDKSITYGSFSADNTEEFSGWSALSSVQKSELLQYMQNMRCINDQFGLVGLNEQTDFRMRLPNSLIECITEINIMSTDNHIEMDIYQPILQSIIHQLKVTCQKLPEHDKEKALDLLNKIGISDKNKMDYSPQIKKIFSELIDIYMKTEKLQKNARELFNKDKLLSANSIDSISQGLIQPTKWITACAIEILLKEKNEDIRRILTDDDFFMLWAKPLLDNDFSKDKLLNKAQKYHLGKSFLELFSNNNSWN